MTKNQKNNAVGDTLSPALRQNAESLRCAPDQGVQIHADAALKPAPISAIDSLYRARPHSQSTWHRWLSCVLLALMMLGLAACNAQPTEPAARDKPPVKAPMGTRLELTLTGYNYTNRYIDRFEVDGQGGGNLFVSEGINGGSKSACCVSYRSGAGAWKAKIRWQAAACTFNDYTDSEGGKHDRTHSFFKEVEVQVDPNVPDQPRYFEVHIYSDGHVEAAITEHDSPSRLILSKDREDRSHYPRCPNDKEPKE